MGNFGRKVHAGLSIITTKGNNKYSLLDVSGILIHTIEINTKIATNYCRITLGRCDLEPGAYLTCLTANSPLVAVSSTQTSQIAPLLI